MNLEDILKIVVAKSASDLFITVGAAPSIKVNGEIWALDQEKLTPEASRDMVLGSMSDKQIAEFEQTHECNYALSQPGIGRFRVSAFIQRNTPGMVLRRIETVIPSLEELKLPPILQNISLTKRGLVIIVGATGSGKSSSMAAMIDHRNRSSSGHIITIEDPIEFIHNNAKSIVTQREVGLDTDSFEIALKNSLRQAPDVILIGEIRSRETMEYAITFAETGHLCLATLHANNANQALDRIINFFPAERHKQLFLDLSLNLRAIVAQQLIPTKDQSGRVPCIELLLNSPLAQERIREGKVDLLKEVMKKSEEQGMRTFDSHLFELYANGLISYEDAIHHADSGNEVRLRIKLATSGGHFRQRTNLSIS